MLDNIQAIKEADKKGVLVATEMLSQQCQQAWQEANAISLPQNYTNFESAVVAGMGGSHLGAQLINAVFANKLTVPLLVENQYDAPAYVNQHTLVIATSFSGTTEETLSFVKQAKEKGAKIVCISSGGPLAELAAQEGWPYYTFESTYNPSRIPRYGSGYLFIAQLVFLAKAGLLKFDQTDFDSIVSTLEAQKSLFGLEVLTDNNPAKKMALELQHHAAVLIASQHLSGSAYIFKNQLNESAKNFAMLFAIPELNHHLLEGLKYPLTNNTANRFVFFESDLYHSRNQARYSITEDIIKEQGFGVSIYKPQTSTLVTQAFETLAFTSYTALYLSILNQVDPGPNPWVDMLKDKLHQIA